jgi:uncharacterized membrane protein YdjX (TVP38/TMEM64 family)
VFRRQNKPRLARKLALAGFLVAVAIIAGFGLCFHFSDFLWGKVHWCYSLCSSHEKLSELVKSWGAWGPVFYILFQATQVLVAPLPGETTGGFVSGFLFGPWLGLLYSLTGLLLGSIVAFLLGRWLGAPLVARWVPPDILTRFRAIAGHRGALVAAVIFALPYFPKDYFCVILGMSGMSLRLFSAVTLAGRFPSAFLFTLQGARLYEGDYVTTLVLLGIVLAFAVFFFIQRERLYNFLLRISGPKSKDQ